MSIPTPRCLHKYFVKDALGMLGIVARYQGENEKAINLYKQAFDISHELKDWQSGTTWLGNLGIAYRAIDKPELSIGYHSSALVMSRAIGHQDQEKKWYNSLGNTYEFLGQRERARECYQEIKMLDNQANVLQKTREQSLDTRNEIFRKMSLPNFAHRLTETEEHLSLSKGLTDQLQDFDKRSHFTNESINPPNIPSSVDYRAGRQNMRIGCQIRNNAFGQSVLPEKYADYNTEAFSIIDKNPVRKTNYTYQVRMSR